MGATRNTGYLENLIQYDASDNVAIATTVNPSYKVTLGGSMLGTSAVFSSSVTASNGTGGGVSGFVLNYGANTSSRTWRLVNDQVVFGDFAIQQSTTQTGTTYTSRLYINASGNVGIGTTSPSTKLTVYGGYTNFTDGTIDIYAGTDGSGGLFGTITNHYQRFITNNTERMRITSGGNVGIGTASPSAPLHVYWASSANTNPTLLIEGPTANNDNYPRLRFKGGTYPDADSKFPVIFTTNGGLGLVLNGGYSTTYNNPTQISLNNGTINFWTASGSSTPLERMTITSGGVVLVNQTSTSAASAGQKMQIATDVLSTGSLAGYFWENRSGGVTSNSNWYGWYTTSGTIYLYNGSANVASINPSTGAYTALSDISKKKDFEASTIGLDAILGLKPTLYRMKTDDENSQKQLGFIAQEVKEFIPQAYIQTKGEKEDFIGLDDRPIIAAMVKAIQEIKAENDQQKAQIESLKALINK